ncbi:DUF2891 domain-containing protein [Niastella caeni]|uniref:DUF2891 domain-containing protein n=1 Tax=Niastella caeni TaxID=2569763 RepID=A0A4S8HW05_9BACT|nr:DUF2891 domain-containing protein [Niastella caeni]THU39381.1 DUF2891 domain-containing protein [Niastella caeni]
MRAILASLISICFCLTVRAQQPTFYTMSADSTQFSLTAEGVAHLASLPLKCIYQEYPNKTGHTASGDSDQVLTPRQLHPVFYGCFDWHSCVHGYWMLARLLKKFPDLKQKTDIEKVFNENITPEKIAVEVAYFTAPLSKSWERTYGWAWLLRLDQELLEWKDEKAQQWHATLQPLTQKIVELWTAYLPKLTYPNRTGVHPNTAFGLVFALDYARAAGNKNFEQAIIKTAINVFGKDVQAPIRWEPDGSDFLSPSLEEVDLMRRVLEPVAFMKWFNQYMPENGLQNVMKIPVVSDRTDLQIVHLDGLCFSRSWCLKGLANALPKTDKRRAMLLKAANRLISSSLPHIASGHYGGEHWLASFAVYALVN